MTRETGADSEGLDQAYGGLEEVHEESRLLAIEVIDEFQGLGGVVTVPAQELTHMGPVFLFDMSIVVFLVGSATSELDVFLMAISPEVMVNEFRAVVGVYGLEGEGQSLTDLPEGQEDAGFAFAHDGSGFHPTGEDVRKVKRPQELSGSALAAMGDQVYLDRARAVHAPGLGLDGDLVPEEGSRLGAPVEAAFEGPFVGFQGPIEGTWADGKQRFLQLRG